MASHASSSALVDNIELTAVDTGTQFVLSSGAGDGDNRSIIVRAGKGNEDLPETEEWKTSCCFTCSGSAPPALWLSYEPEFEFWGESDLMKDEVEEYLKRISSSQSDLQRIYSELRASCHYNYKRRLKVTCRFLVNDLKIPLHSHHLEGDMKESLLHHALGRGNTEAAKVLIKYGGKPLIFKHYTQPGYSGVTALHQAIVIENFEIVQTMLHSLEAREQYELIHSQAKATSCSSGIRFSGLPLALAAFGNHKDMFDHLLESGAELDASDCYTGNTVLHSLVEYSKWEPDKACKMIVHVLTGGSAKRWWCKRMGIPHDKLTEKQCVQLKAYLLGQENNDGFTPLTLSGKLLAYDASALLLQVTGVYRLPVWNSGFVEYTLYDMSEIDPAIVPRGKPSLFEMIIYSSHDGVLPILATQPIKHLMQVKWCTYRMPYYIWGITHFILMMGFTHLAKSRPLRSVFPNETLYEELYSGGPDSDSDDILYWMGEAIIFISAIVLLSSELFDCILSIRLFLQTYVWKRQGHYYKAPWQVIFKIDYFRIILTVFGMTTVISLALQISLDLGMDVPLSIALAFGWYFSLFFTRAFPPLSFFTVMLEHLMFGPLMRFLVVFVIMLYGFSSGMVVLYQEGDKGLPEELSSSGDALLSSFRLIVGLGDYNFWDHAHHQLAAKILYVGFVIILTVLLLNMLIAHMSDSFANLTDGRSHLLQKLQMASILLLERRLSFNGALKLQRYLYFDPKKKRWFLPVEEKSISVEDPGTNTP